MIDFSWACVCPCLRAYVHVRYLHVYAPLCYSHEQIAYTLLLFDLVLMVIDGRPPQPPLPMFVCHECNFA